MTKIQNTNDAANTLDTSAKAILAGAGAGLRRGAMDSEKRQALRDAASNASALLEIACEFDGGASAATVFANLRMDNFKFEEVFSLCPAALAFMASAYAAEEGVSVRSLFSASGWAKIKQFIG